MIEQSTLHDPGWLVLVKVLLVFVILLTWTIFNVWFERRVLGRMQNRKGPIMNGPLGLGQALGDGVKLIFKEDFRPARTDAFVFNLAPVLTAVAAFTSWSVIPFGGNVRMFGVDTRLQMTDLPVSVLFIIAIASVGAYGVVLAGWSSNGTYSLLGSMRATAQVISYEIAMGLSLVAVFMLSQSMSTNDIVQAQMQPWIVLPGAIPDLPSWYFLLLIPSFAIYVISMFGETLRLPFDFAECESELVSGHITDFSGFRYAMYFLAEYINMATVSAVCTTLFLGGYGAPWPFNQFASLNDGWITLLWFFLKVQCVIFFFAWTRAALPRLRYDQFMDLGWKWLIPISLVWILLLGTFRTAFNNNWWSQPWFIAVAVAIFIILMAWLWWFGRKEDQQIVEREARNEAMSAELLGSYPVPPMPGQELVGVIASTADEAEPRRARRSAADANDSDTQQGADA